MSFSVQPCRDVEPASPCGAEPGHWRSTGDDPGFRVALGLSRQRYLCVELSSLDAILAPQIYFDYGFGFHERNSMTLRESGAMCIVVDVGRFGAIRALRIDPAAIRMSFRLETRAFDTAEAAREHCRAWEAAHAGGHVEWIARTGLLWALRSFLGGRLGRITLPAHLKSLYELSERELADYEPSGEDAPWLSVVVPTYNTQPRYLDDLLGSFRRQGISGVELIFSDDASTQAATLKWLRAAEERHGVRVLFNAVNGGIARATNAGLALARGRWVTLLDHDDLIAPFALKMIHRALSHAPEAAFLYTDEVVVNKRLRPRGLLAKPAYDPVLLSGLNYINHFSVYRRDRLEEIGRLREGFEGSQDYDLLLRYLDGIAEERVLHLPYPAYWWRRDGQSFSARHLGTATASARRALGERYGRKGEAAAVAPALTPSLHRPSLARSHAPRVSVIVPSKDALDHIATCMDGLLNKTDYPDIEILIVDNGSQDPAVLDLYARLEAANANVRIDIALARFNFARAVNKGFALATGEHFLLLNNDVSMIEPGWLAEMVECLEYDRAGIVGAKLLYPDSRIQHAGVVAGFGGLAGHWFLGKPSSYGGPMNRLHVRGSMTCVTAAAMLVSSDCREAVGDMDEDNFAVAYNDVDYCLRAYRAGFRCVWTPFAALYHHESATRGSEKPLANRIRFEREKQNLRQIHATEHFLDPAASPHYGRDRSTPELVLPAGLPAPRRWLEPAAKEAQR